MTYEQAAQKRQELRHAAEAAEHDDPWSSFGKYPVSDWRHHVSCDYTREGYWDWVYNNIENEDFE